MQLTGLLSIKCEKGHLCRYCSRAFGINSSHHGCGNSLGYRGGKQLVKAKVVCPYDGKKFIIYDGGKSLGTYFQCDKCMNEYNLLDNADEVDEM